MVDATRAYSLLLNIGGLQWESPAFALVGPPTDVTWLDAPNSRLSIKKFSNDVLIGASVRGPYEGCAFRLRIPYDGCQSRWLTKVDAGGRMYVMKKGCRMYSVPLLHQAVGVYTLVLEFETDGGEFVPVLNVPMEVETQDAKLAIVNGMVDELLAFDHLPFQVLSQDKAAVWGRIKMFYSDDSRQSGRAVSWSRFEALKKLEEQLSPLLNRILEDGASRLGYKEMFCRVRDVHGFDRSIIRQITRRGVVDYGRPEVQSLTIRVKEPIPSRDLPAHRVIRTFLEMCARECVAVLNRLVRDLGEADIRDIRKHQLGLQKVEFDKKVLPFFDRNLREMNSWCQDRRVVAVEDADPSWFEITDEYKKIYLVMLRYKMVMKGRRIESGALANVDYRRMEHGQPSTLQKKYDYIYEAWCYLRLVKAFISLGFDEIKENYHNTLSSNDEVDECFLPHEMINRPLVARKGRITVLLYYRVRAETATTAKFYLPPKFGDRQVLEPDYLMVFMMDGVEKKYAVIMDAKAKAEIGECDRNARNDYLLRFDINDYYHFSQQIKRPAQSWLLYMGSGYDENAKIEFSDSGEDDLDEINKGSVFGGGQFDLQSFDFSRYYVGHVRVNAKAVEEVGGGDVFTSWVSTQIKLAEKYLSQK